MLPAGGSLLKQVFQETYQPSKTFLVDLESGRIRGVVDGLTAIRQSVRDILYTERFEWLIYSWNYGVELKDLYGKSQGAVKAKIKKRIQEALTQDDRVKSVDAFSFSVTGRRMSVEFTVHTTLGDLETGMEVEF